MISSSPITGQGHYSTSNQQLLPVQERTFWIIITEPAVGRNRLMMMMMMIIPGWGVWFIPSLTSLCSDDINWLQIIRRKA